VHLYSLIYIDLIVYFVVTQNWELLTEVLNLIVYFVVTQNWELLTEVLSLYFELKIADNSLISSNSLLRLVIFALK